MWSVSLVSYKNFEIKLGQKWGSRNELFGRNVMSYDTRIYTPDISVD